MVEATTLSVHRCRFVDFSPSAITSLAFPPLPLSSAAKGKKAVDPDDASQKFGPLVVGRSNGNIELCEWTGSSDEVEAPQAWVVRKTLSGPIPSKVDSLALAIRSPDDLKAGDIPSFSDLRLFSTGGGSELIEWDIEQAEVRRTISSQGGSIWSVAVNPSSSRLALGCEDGSIHLLSLEDDAFSHYRRFDRCKSRILSLAWGPPVPRASRRDVSNIDPNDSDPDSDSDDEDPWSDSWIIAGCSDSSLRKWDVTTGKVLDRMGTDKMRGERTLVWTVGVLGDGTVVSGDSLGMVKFWDSGTCTQLQSFQAHAADVLCSVIGPEGTTIYTAGVDQKTTQFTLVKTTSSTVPAILSSSKRWVQTSSKRMHSHDVRALAIWPPYTPLPQPYQRPLTSNVAPILASGGLDMSVAVTPAALPRNASTRVKNPLGTSVVATFEDAYHRRLAYPTGCHGTSAVYLARQARLVLCLRDTGVTLWRILRKSSGVEVVDEHLLGEQGGWEKILEMDLNVRSNLTAGAISRDGKWLVVSDHYEVKLFRLQPVEGMNDLKPKRVRDFSSLLQSQASTSTSSAGASAFLFTPDSSKLIVANNASYVLFIDLGQDTGVPRVLRRFSQHRLKNVVVRDRIVKGRKGDEDVEMAETQSEDGGVPSVDEEADNFRPMSTTITRMAVSTDGQWLATTDDHRRTHIFNLDSVQHHSVLPTFPQLVHALAFSPTSPSLLILGFANNTIELYDVEARQFPSWSRAVCDSLPKRFKHMHDPILGVTLAPHPTTATANGKQNVLALFWGATWLCKVQFDAPVGWGGFERKRRRKAAAGSGQVPNFKVITHYRQILLAEFMASGELVVVERPLMDVLARLPPAYFKPKYGAT
ncbi:WD40 repeat-like protein [Amylostereum chailletii]|nr:WD40 repeat-like protein [Amylostereum chailletii]